MTRDLTRLAQTQLGESYVSFYFCTAAGPRDLPYVPSSSTPFRCTTMGTSIVPLEPLARRLEAWLALPSPSRWLTRTIRLGYAIQFAMRPFKFSDILETSVAARNAPAQAHLQDADAQVHDQMHPAPGLVCSDRRCRRTALCPAVLCGTEADRGDPAHPAPA